jgi:lactoylglutathione lyase
MTIEAVFEVAVKVQHLPVSSMFYKAALGFTEGLHDKKRRWLFLWVGRRQGMVVLQEDQGRWLRQHIAFRVRESDLPRLKAQLESHNVVVEGPVPLDWMNALSLYFSDPDGHQLELCALSSAEPRGA